MAEQRTVRRSTVIAGGGLLTKEEWRRFDISKMWVLIALLGLALILWLLNMFNANPAGGPVAVATTTPTAAPTAVAVVATNTPVPEPTKAPPAATVVASAPAIDPQDGVIPAGTVTFTGLAAPGAEIDIQIDGVSVGKTKADAKGQWSFDADVKAGDHEVVVVAPDSAGGASAPQSFQIGSGAGPDPVNVTAPASGASVAPGPVQFAGTAGPEQDLIVRVDGVEVARIKADAQGAWATELDLPAGAHNVVVAPVGLDGTVFDEAASAPVDLTAETQAVTPVFTTPDASATLAAGPVIFKGTAAPGSTIVLKLDGGDVRTVTAEDDGTWSAQIELPAGAHSLVAVATQPDGLEASSEAFNVTAEAARPAITSPAGGNVLSGNVVLRGTASPNQTVEIVVDGVVVGTTTSDAKGNWFLSTPLTAGARSVVARYAGASETSEAVAYTVQQRRAGGQCRNTTPIAAEVSRYTVEVNDTLYCISQRSGLSIAALKRDNAFITDENLILPGQVLVLREHVPPTPTPAP